MKPDPPELSLRRKRVAQSIIGAMVILNVAMFTLFLSVAASFTHQERVVTADGRALCERALAESLGQSAFHELTVVGDLSYVDTAVAEGAYWHIDDAGREQAGAVRCTFDAPNGRDSLRVVDVEVRS